MLCWNCRTPLFRPFESDRGTEKKWRYRESIWESSWYKLGYKWPQELSYCETLWKRLCKIYQSKFWIKLMKQNLSCGYDRGFEGFYNIMFFRTWVLVHADNALKHLNSFSSALLSTKRMLPFSNWQSREFQMCLLFTSHSFLMVR